ncbi:MAG: hemerythrin family protein [Rubrivivax sp.]|nr:hemerythrin family protein [Rubrivivax sp.]
MPLIDGQHAALIAELNRLILDQQAGWSTEVLVDVLSELGRALDDHFRCEEGLFSSLGMSGAEIDAHVAAHLEILSQYVELNLDLMRQPQAHSAAHALGLVRQWVVGHILSHDLRLRALLPS